MEERLNTAGVPAARVRRLGEFLDEAASPQTLNFQPNQFSQGSENVQTPGLGFQYKHVPDASIQGAPSHGNDTDLLLTELGLKPERIAELRVGGVIK
jgi:crotonobetainyl-CoA:carnitine CoA-transferase CaiB-like acyl-CoA transferase